MHPLRFMGNFSKAVASALFVFVLVVMGGMGHALASVNGAAAEFEGTLFVRGVGQVEVEPDQVILTFSARALRPSASEAMAEQARQTSKSNEILQDAGIPVRDIQTQHISLREEWEYVQNERVLRGYVAEQRIQVAVDDLSQVGVLIDALVREDGSEAVQNDALSRQEGVVLAEDCDAARY